MNASFFADEGLDDVLLTLVRIGCVEGQAFAASALGNLARSPELRTRLKESDLFNIGFDVFHDKNESHDLKNAILRVFRKMCKEKEFREKVAESHFLSMAANDRDNYCAVLQIVKHVPEMSTDEKGDFLDAFGRVTYKTDEVIRRTMDCIGVVSEGVEDGSECSVAINRLVNVVNGNPDDLAILLDIAARCPDRDGVLRKNRIYRDICDSAEYDSRIKSAALQICTKSS
jgi:hypothetical protein